MRILAIETSSKSVSVALLDQTELILELNSDFVAVNQPASSTRRNAGSNDQLPPGFVRKRSKGDSKTSRIFPPGASVLLAPMIKSIFDQTGLPISSIELVAVTAGPGSFTGLRVGVVTAKTLAYSNQAQIIGVNTLEAIAAQTAQLLSCDSEATQPIRICPVVNAQRQQVFAGCYLTTGVLTDPGWRIESVTPNEILDREAWLSTIQRGDVLTGPGLKGVLPEQTAESTEYDVASENCWHCTATSIGRLAWRQYQAGKRDNPWELEPLYFRPSSAEEVRNAKIKRGDLK